MKKKEEKKTEEKKEKEFSPTLTVWRKEFLDLLQIYDTENNALLFREAFYYQTTFPLVGQQANIVTAPIVDTSSGTVSLSTNELQLIERIH